MKPKIFTRHSFEPQKQKTDLTVFIDVFRASTSLLYLLRQDPKEIIGLNEYTLIRKYIDNGYLLISEVFPDGLDNSPSIIEKQNLKDKNIVMKTGNFITAIFNNMQFSQAIAASFVNIDTVAEFIRNSNYSTIEIVAAAHFPEQVEAVEDSSCSAALVKLINNENVEAYPRLNEIREKIENRKIAKFNVPPQYWTDVELALQRNIIPIVPKIKKLDEQTIHFEKI